MPSRAGARAWPRARWTAPLLALLAAAWLGACERPLAEVEVLAAAVTVRHDGQSAPVSGRAGLRAGDLVATGPTGRARLTMRASGDTLELGPDAAVLIAPDAYALSTLRLDLQVLRGQVRASAGGKAGLLIGTPHGVARVLGEGSPLKFTIDLRTGAVNMTVGQISFLGADGSSHALATTDTLRFTLGKLELVKAGQPAETRDLGTTAPLVFTLGAAKGASVRKSGQARWQRVEPGTRLAAGDTVRAGNGRARIDYAPGARLELAPASEVVLAAGEGLRRGDQLQSSSAGLRLASGTLSIDIDSAAGPAHQLSLQSEAGAVVVRPGRRQAKVEVRRNARAGDELTVYAGQVELPGGQVLSAGQIANLKTGATATLEQRLGRRLIEAQDGRTHVHYAAGPPPLRLDWQRARKATGPFVVQLAQDPAFKRLVLEEQVEQRELVLPPLTQGSYHWRVSQAGEGGASVAGGVIHLDRGGNVSGKLARRNVVRETGETTTILYQTLLPQVQLQWSPIEGALRYEVLVYQGENFDTPKHKREAREAKLDFERGDFVAAKYYWYVTAYGEGDAKLRASPMNELLIERDARETLLEVHAPLPNAKISRGGVARGVVHADGAVLQVNGKRVALDDNGAFSAPHGLGPGAQTMVFEIDAGKGEQHVYLVPVVVK